MCLGSLLSFINVVLTCLKDYSRGSHLRDQLRPQLARIVMEVHPGCSWCSHARAVAEPSSSD